jgi:hypothetical protein
VIRKSSRIPTLVLALVLALLWACFQPALLATARPGPDGAGAKVSLEQAIKIAKEAIPVPPEFDQFNSGFSEGVDYAVWNLEWSGTAEGVLHVSVNAHDGKIMNMHSYRPDPPGTKYRGFPKYTRETAQTIAEELVARLYPDWLPQTRLAPEPPPAWPMPASGPREYPVTHQYYFQRLSSGIPVVDNGITLEINGETGALQHLNVAWAREPKLPSASGRIGIERARQVFDLEGLELVYVYTGPGQRDTGQRPYPVYRVRDGGFLLDALTGKLIDPEDWHYGGADGGREMDEAAKIQTPSLSPAEIKVVEETRELLTAGAARRAAETAYPPPGGFTVTRSELVYNWSAPGSKIWSFHYESKERDAYLNLAVDARSGEFLRFHTYQGMDRGEHLKEPQVNVTEAQAQEKAEALMRRLAPGKAGQTVLRHTRREMHFRPGDAGPEPRAYRFEFARLVNGIPYPENGFSVTVDTNTGEVTAFTLNWWDTVFPKLGGIVPRDKVNTAYLARSPLVLEYTRMYPRWREERLEPGYALVYRLSGRTDIMVDARSGRELDRQGNPVVVRVQNFTDIAGHAAEREIKLLVGAGIITGEGDRFRPDDPVKNAELVTMLVVAYGGGHDRPGPSPEGTPWYEPFIRRAVAMGILDTPAQLAPLAPTTRIQAARLFVNAAGFGPLAKLAPLFRFEAADAGSVPPEDKGYAAAAVGLGLLPLEDGRFKPAGTVTRGEVAQILVRTLESRN